MDCSLWLLKPCRTTRFAFVSNAGRRARREAFCLMRRSLLYHGCRHAANQLAKKTTFLILPVDPHYGNVENCRKLLKKAARSRKTATCN
jgi:hypothetical protein